MTGPQPPAATLRHLFVYGTLRPGAAHPMADRLARESALVGAASIAGRLYSLGPYPGLLPARGDADVVHGDLVELVTDPIASLAWLDEYEGTAGSGSEYVRVVTTATLADGRSTPAFVYQCILDIDEARRIPSGDWLRR